MNLLSIACIILLLHLRDADLCNINVCLKWKLSNNRLTFICKVNSLRFYVIIFDPFKRERAFCGPPLLHANTTDKCLIYQRNGSISQNLKTNETTVTFFTQIDQTIDGIWTCRHGSKNDNASVDITHFNSQQGITVGKNESDIQPCWLVLTWWTMTGFNIFFIFTRLFIWIIYCLLGHNPKKGDLDSVISDRMTRVCLTITQCSICPRRIKKTKITDCKKIAFVLLILYGFGLPFTVGLIEMNMCAGHQGFVVVGGICGVFSNLLLFDRGVTNIYSPVYPLSSTQATEDEATIPKEIELERALCPPNDQAPEEFNEMGPSIALISTIEEESYDNV